MHHAESGNPVAGIFDEPQQREQVLDVRGVKKLQAAELLGISRMTLRSKLRALDAEVHTPTESEPSPANQDGLNSPESPLE